MCGNGMVEDSKPYYDEANELGNLYTAMVAAKASESPIDQSCGRTKTRHCSPVNIRWTIGGLHIRSPLLRRNR